MRPWTDPVKNANGSTSFIIKRVCDGCGKRIGDVIDEEIKRAINGLSALSVIQEHGCAA